MATLEQRRAQDAWEKSAGCSKDYVKAAKSLPALIMNSGLVQVLAFCHEKGGANEQVAQHLRTWLLSRFTARFASADFALFIEAMMQAPPNEFQAITAEAFAWLKWLRQMAAARQG